MVRRLITWTKNSIRLARHEVDPVTAAPAKSAASDLILAEHPHAASNVPALFDANYYRSQLRKEVNACDAWAHFDQHVLTSGASPCESFDAAYYLQINTDVFEAGTNPLVHYVRSGREEGRAALPPPEASIVRECDEELVGRFMCVEHYVGQLKHLKDFSIDPARHYISIGHRLGLEPNPAFSVADYTLRNADVDFAGVLPLLHFLKRGRLEGRSDRSDGKSKSSYVADLASIRSYFDEDFYLMTYIHLKRNLIDPIKHYYHFGWKEGLNPSGNFCTDFYLSFYPDVRAAGINPLLHYVRSGEMRGRIPKWPESIPRHVDDWTCSPVICDLMREAFDQYFYASAYNDIRRNRLHPFEHFIASGWKEGRDPNAWFSMNYYLERYPDASLGRINPFLHYLVYGRNKGFDTKMAKGVARALQITSKSDLIDPLDFLLRSRKQATQVPARAGGFSID